MTLNLLIKKKRRFFNDQIPLPVFLGKLGGKVATFSRPPFMFNGQTPLFRTIHLGIDERGILRLPPSEHMTNFVLFSFFLSFFILTLGGG